MFYDTQGRLAAVNWFDATSQEFRTEHEYDAYHRRVRSTVTRIADQGVVNDERYAYDGWNLVERQNLLDANDRITYIYGPNEQLIAHQERLNGRTVYYFGTMWSRRAWSLPNLSLDSGPTEAKAKSVSNTKIMAIRILFRMMAA